MKINLTSNEFPNIVVAYLLDKFLHPDEVSVGNEQFDELIEDMRVRGMLPLSRTYYLQMSALYRVKYKLIKDVFNPTTPAKDSSIINIYGDPEKVEKAGILKTILRKMLGIEAVKEQFTEEEINLLTEEFLSEEEVLNG